MAEFTPINTQEEFDTLIKDRLARNEKKVREEYADYDELKKQSESWVTQKQKYEQTLADNKTAYDDLNQKLIDANGKIAQYETDALKTRIAIESQIPLELRDYLKGTTEDEIKKSAEELGKFAKPGQKQPPADPEGDLPRDDFNVTNKINTDRAMKKFMKALETMNE